MGNICKCEARFENALMLLPRMPKHFSDPVITKAFVYAVERSIILQKLSVSLSDVDWRNRMDMRRVKNHDLS